MKSNNNNNNNLSVVPVVLYIKANTNKFAIFRENKGKCGIYRLNNKVTNKSSVGSYISLSNRFKTYYYLSYLTINNRKGI
jgi:hypothetical protein